MSGLLDDAVHLQHGMTKDMLKTLNYFSWGLSSRNVNALGLDWLF